MAKKEEPKNGRSKMTVMLFQLDGSDQSLLEGIRTISGAIQGMVRPARVLPLAAGNPLPPGEESEPVGDDAPQASGEDVDAGQISEAEPRRSTPPRAPQVLPDLKVPVDALKLFCESKRVGNTDTKRYLAIAAFLKEQMSITSVTADHIYTCYRLLGWNIRADAGAPLRALKRNGHFQKGAEAGAYILNHVGENAVRDMGKEPDAT